VPTLGTPIKVDGSIDRPVTAAPDLGEHTDLVLGGWLAYPAERVAALRRDGVVK
jgi:crotonobetainyl-CoA:carnitine CoA-transferase CaiB-like acyl-CoA transferase